jgi:ornithine cyclodeaminase/alanine dehydrogenase-like protein (mu-crystallin family)
VTFISAMRTGAVTGLGARYLANKDSKTMAMIGAGVQARTQLAAVQVAVPGLREVRAYDLRWETAQQYAKDMAEQLHLDVRAVRTPEEAVRGADIVVTATVADEPIVQDRWMKAGSFFSAVGSYQEQEFEVVTHSDKVVVDNLEHVMHRVTPVVALMVTQGKLDPKKVSELGAVICGDRPGRERHDERIFFSPIGAGSEDLILVFKAYQVAREKGLGLKLKLFGE